MRAIDFSASVVAWPRGINGLLLCLLGGFPRVRATDFGCASVQRGHVALMVWYFVCLVGFRGCV